MEKEDSSGSWRAGVISPVSVITLGDDLTRGCMEFLMAPPGYQEPISGINYVSLGHLVHPSSRQLVNAHFYFRLRCFSSSPLFLSLSLVSPLSFLPPPFSSPRVHPFVLAFSSFFPGGNVPNDRENRAADRRENEKRAARSFSTLLKRKNRGSTTVWEIPFRGCDCAVRNMAARRIITRAVTLFRFYTGRKLRSFLSPSPSFSPGDRIKYKRWNVRFLLSR